MANHVLIGGGTGFIGTYIIKLLKSRGIESTIVSRMPGPQSISWTDLANQGLPKTVDAVVNLAGQNILDPTRRWTDGFKQNVWTSRINTTAALADAISKASPRPIAFVSFSGVGIYPPSKSAEYDEDSKVTDFDFLSKLCHAWEAAALHEGKETTRTSIIRSGVILGRRGGMIKNMWLPFYLGVGGPIGDGTQFLPWMHIDDLTNLILFCIENDNARGVFNGVAPQAITNKEFTNAFARAMWRPAFFPVPVPILNLAFGGERAKVMADGQKVIPRRAQSIGFEYKYPTIQEACFAIVAEK